MLLRTKRKCCTRGPFIPHQCSSSSEGFPPYSCFVVEIDIRNVQHHVGSIPLHSDFMQHVVAILHAIVYSNLHYLQPYEISPSPPKSVDVIPNFVYTFWFNDRVDRLSYAINNIIRDTSRAGFGLEDVEDTAIFNVVSRSPDGFGVIETVCLAQNILHCTGIADPGISRTVSGPARMRRAENEADPSVRKSRTSGSTRMYI